MNIDKLEAGRELDALVAEKVMRWQLLNSETYEPVTSDSERKDASNNDGWHWEGRDGHSEAWEWRPSSKIRDAWKVLLRLRELGFSYRIYAIDEQAGVGCNLWGGPADNYWFAYSESGLFVDALTAEIAICRAALKVVNAGKKSRECPG